MLTKPLAKILKPFARFKKSGFLFMNPSTQRPYSRPSYATVLRKAATDAGISRNVTTHTLRHTLGTIVRCETGSVIALMKALGYSSSKISEGYIQGDRQHKKLAALTMAKVLGS